MERTQFTFFASFAKAAERIRKKTDRCEFYDVVKDYALYGKEPDLDGLPDSVAVAFELVMPNIDASRRKAESGKNGGKRKQTESKSEANRKQTEAKRKQTEAKRKQGKAASKKESEKEKEGENENEKEKEKESECSPPIVPSDGLAALSPAMRGAVEDWMQYKAEKREPYKPQGLKSLISEVNNTADRYGDAAVIELIRQCMSNNWRGIIFDRLKKAPDGGKSSNVFLDMLHERGGAHDG